MNVQLVEDLRAARALIERGWCRDTAARNEAGRMVDTRSPEARYWCAAGACNAVQPNAAQRIEMLLQLERCVPDSVVRRSGCSITAFNDHSRSVARVLALFDHAIAAAEAA